MILVTLMNKLICKKPEKKEVKNRIGGEILVQEAVKEKLGSEIKSSRKVLDDMIK